MSATPPSTGPTIPGPTIPAWDPPWQFTGDLGHVRVLPGRLANSPTYSCPEQDAKKARPGVYPVRDRRVQPGRPEFAEVAIGLVREVVLDHVERRAAPTPESIEQSAVRAAAPRLLAPATALVVQAGVAGYRGALQSLRESGDIAVDAVLVPDLVIAEPQAGGGVTEWAAWGLHWVDRHGVRETHLLVWRDAGSRPRTPAVLAVVAHVAADGFRAERAGSWSTRFEAHTVQPPPVRTVRVREIGVLDGSTALLFDGDPAAARALFERDVPPVLPVLAGGAHRPGSACAGCAIREECQGLPRVPGVLAVAGRAPYPRRLSTSDLWSHDVCPQQVHLTADLGLPREPMPELESARRGRLVHAWLETAHDRGVGCTDADLPRVGAPGDIATSLEWSEADTALAAPFLSHHIDDCPLARPDVLVARPECPVAVHDTDADVILTTRPDLVLRVATVDGPALVVRETKTLSMRRLEADEELGLLHHFPQVAASVCLLAGGVDLLDPSATFDPVGSVVELELLGADTAVVIAFPADDPEVVLRARIALAERVDAWIYDVDHTPRPGRQCERCPVRVWCPASATADHAERVSEPTDSLPLDVLALIEAEAPVLDEDFPF